MALQLPMLQQMLLAGKRTQPCSLDQVERARVTRDAANGTKGFPNESNKQTLANLHIAQTMVPASLH